MAGNRPSAPDGRTVPEGVGEARRALRVAYWTLSLQLPRRLRDRRVQHARTRAVAASPLVEGRSPKTARPAEALIRAVAESSLFNRDWYLTRYPDVAAAGLDPAEHYVSLGAAEGRSPGPDFDTAEYLYRNPDVAATGVNPLLHYLERGMAEGRDASPVDPYARWVREFDTLDDADRAAMRAHISGLARRPLISVVVPAYNTDERHLRDMIESVRQQIYPHWELCIADDASTRPHVACILQEFATLDPRIKIVRRETNGHVCAATNSALDLATGEFIALLDHDDTLAEQALYEVAVELETHPDADVVYSDADHMDDSGRRWAPYFKTEWDPDLMLGHNMVSHLGVYRRSLVESVGRLRVGFEGSQDYDLMLRVADATTWSRIRHVPAILYHWRRNSASPSFSESALERCVVAARRAIRELSGALGDTRARRACTEDGFLHSRRVCGSRQAAAGVGHRADTRSGRSARALRRWNIDAHRLRTARTRHRGQRQPGAGNASAAIRCWQGSPCQDPAASRRLQLRGDQQSRRAGGSW